MEKTTTPGGDNVTEMEALVFHQTLVDSDAVIKVCHGAFLKPGDVCDVVRVMPDSIELWRLDAGYQALIAVSRLPLFATVLNAVTVPFPSPSGTSAFTDAIIIATDSGHLTMMRYVVAPGARDTTGEWVVLDRTPLGRGGVRVTGLGAYLCIDCHSRSVMVGAAMVHKRVFPLIAEAEGDDRGSLRFGSQLDLSSQTILFDACAVEVAPDENCLFATIESTPLGGETAVTSEGGHEKHVCFYEYSPSLNVVNRILAIRYATAHALIAVPHEPGPGGVLICTEQELFWESVATRSLTALQGAPAIRVEMPRRLDLASTSPDPMIIASCITKRKEKGFFLLVQNELGDMFRVDASKPAIDKHFKIGTNVRTRDATTPEPLQVTYFDTIAPARHLALFKNGFMVTATEAGPHALYRVIGDGTKSGTLLKRGRGLPATTAAPGISTFGRAQLKLTKTDRLVLLFQRHFNAETGKPELRNLQLCQSTENSAETMAVHCITDTQKRMCFLRLTGRSGQHAAIQAIRYGTPTYPVRSTTLPAAFDTIIPLEDAVSLFTTPADVEFNKFALSSPRGTIVVRLGDEIQVDSEAGFLNTAQTLAAATIISGNGYVQVHPRGIELIGRPEAVHWTHPQLRLITAADCNCQQVVAGFDNGGIMAFDFGLTGSEFNQVCNLPTFPNVRCVSIAPRTPTGSPGEFVAVFNPKSGEVSVLQIRNSVIKPVEVVKFQPESVHSLLLTSLDIPNVLTLLIGLQDGRLVRVELDSVQGTRRSTKPYQCGTSPVRVTRGANPSSCIVASSELWKCHSVDGAFKISPIVVKQSVIAASVGGALPAIAAVKRRRDRGQLLLVVNQKTLSILSVKAEDSRSATAYNVTSCPLGTLTGRRLLAHPTRPSVVVALCTEFRGYNPSDVDHLRERNNGIPLELLLSERCPNPLPKHTSCVHLYDAANNIVTPGLFMDDSEVALSITIGSFSAFGKEPVIILGCASQYHHGHGVQAPSWQATSLRAYRFALPSLTDDGNAALAMPKLERVHVTMLEHGDLATALHINSQHNFLLAGFGPEEGLHMFEWSMHRMLWKRKMVGVLKSRIVSLETIADTTSAASFTAAGYSQAHALSASQNTLILCGMQDQSVAVVRYLRQSDASVLLVIASDPIPRFVTCACFVDDRTIAVADRFGSVVVLRIPSSTRMSLPGELGDVAEFNDIQLDEAVAFRSRQPLVPIHAFHVGQTITSLQVASRPPAPGITTEATPTLVYGTVTGKIGVLVPFPTEEDAISGMFFDQVVGEFFHSPVGRPLLQHRSRINPKLHVVDGDTIQLMVQAKQTFFNDEARAALDARRERLFKVHADHRKILGLPEQLLRNKDALMIRMRSLLGLSE